MIKYILPVLVLLGGCTSTQINKAPALNVVSVTNTLTLKLNSNKLSLSQKDAVRNFIERKGMAYGLKVKLISHSSLGQGSEVQLANLLKESGIPSKNIERGQLIEQGKGDVQILVESFKVEIPKCRPQTYSNNFMNHYKEHPSFGCANSVALAQMVANPKDLVVGENLGPTNGAKAVSTISGYVAPIAETSSQTDTQGALTTGFGAN